MNIVVHHAQLVEAPGEPFWQITIEVEHDDGRVERLGHLMPATAVEWRVAQYNVNAETAIKMLLVEPYMVPDEQVLPDLEPTRQGARDVQAARVDSALAGGDVTFVEGEPPFLMADPNANQSVLADSGADSPLGTLVDNSPLSPPHIDVKREFLDAQRAVTQEQAAPMMAARSFAAAGPGWQRESAEQLRASLIPHETERSEP